MNGQTGFDSGGREQDLTAKVKDVGADFKAKASQLADQVTEAAREQVSEIGATAKKFAADAVAGAQSAIEEQKSLGSEYVVSVASAIHRAAGEVDKELPFASKYLRHTAEQIEHAAEAVRNRNARELVSEVEDFARRQPALFFGGAMLLGFAALRFLKSAPDSASRGNSSGMSAPEVNSPSMSEFDDGLRDHTHEGA